MRELRGIQTKAYSISGEVQRPSSEGLSEGIKQWLHGTVPHQMGSQRGVICEEQHEQSHQGRTLRVCLGSIKELGSASSPLNIDVRGLFI